LYLSKKKKKLGAERERDCDHARGPIKEHILLKLWKHACMDLNN